MKSLEHRIQELETQNTPQDTLIEQALTIWHGMGIELSVESAEQIAANYRKLGYTKITWESLVLLMPEQMKEL